jgi:hypothetical protein
VRSPTNYNTQRVPRRGAREGRKQVALGSLGVVVRKRVAVRLHGGLSGELPLGGGQALKPRSRISAEVKA